MSMDIIANIIIVNTIQENNLDFAWLLVILIAGLQIFIHFWYG